MTKFAPFFALLLLGACTSPEIIEPAVTSSTRAPILLDVGEVRVESETPPLTEGDFKDRRRSKRLAEAVTDFLERRVLAGDGTGWVRLSITKASIIERPRSTTGGIVGVFTEEPDSDLNADVAVRLTVIDEVGLERSRHDIAVGRTRALGESLDVVERDAQGEALISDLLRQLDGKLTTTVDSELAYLRAF